MSTNHRSIRKHEASWTLSSKGQQPRLFGEDGWDKLNRAEQVIARYLDTPRLKFEYDHLLSLARSRKIPSLDTFEGYAKNFFSNPRAASAPVTPGSAAENLREQQRSAYQALLYALQSGFVEARFERRLRGHTAIQLLIWGSIILVLSQAQFGTLRFEDISDNYRGKILGLRLLCGAIGAMIFYCILRSGLIDGQMFPDWKILENTQVAELAGLNSSSPAARRAFLAEWSKLLVWSFLAGFSERLVPQTLDRVGVGQTASNSR